MSQTTKRDQSQHQQHSFHQESLPASSTTPSNLCSPHLLLIKIALTSFRLFLSYPRIYFTIFTFTTLPLSLIISSLSFSTRSVVSHYHHLHYLAGVVPIRVESQNILDEAHNDARFLFFIKALHALPLLIFSLISLIVTVNTTSSLLHTSPTAGSTSKSLPHTFRAALKVVIKCWIRPFFTCIVAYAMTVICVHIMHSVLMRLVVMNDTNKMMMGLFVVVDLIVEVYLMAVISSGLVVSVVEESRSGVEAIKIGAGLMKGMRISGWLLSGGFLLVSSWIGKQLRMDFSGGGEDSIFMWRFVDCFYKGGLILLLGLIVLWSFVVGTVYYSECRKVYLLLVEDDVESN